MRNCSATMIFVIDKTERVSQARDAVFIIFNHCKLLYLSGLKRYWRIAARLFSYLLRRDNYKCITTMLHFVEFCAMIVHNYVSRESNSSFCSSSSSWCIADYSDILYLKKVLSVLSSVQLVLVFIRCKYIAGKKR